MSRLQWGKPQDRYFDVGLDRGVLYPRTKPAVAWNGLISVDENGGDNATIFYMDGRPYHVHVTPKEYQANIKAYTYPDEFSEKMGLLEIADGLYADSQYSDVFDLSYRTKVGNGLTQDAAYKIHLVYNCVVSPGGVGYSSISNSISPTNFDWEINATPAVLEGHRPTAHFVIDTRHLSPERVATIEDLLYGVDNTTLDAVDGGTPSSNQTLLVDGGTLYIDTTVAPLDGGTPTIVPLDPADVFDGGAPSGSVYVDAVDGGSVAVSGSLIISPAPGSVLDGGIANQVTVAGGGSIYALPPVQTIFDTLAYTNNVITVTNLGDGTWTVEASYENLKVNLDGTFTLLNANAVDTGNGTFQLSDSTGA